MNLIKKVMNSSIVIIVGLIMITVVASVPAFRSAIYEGHDLKFHFGRIQSLAEELASLHLPVRYESNAWYGHGYVSPLFYGDIFLYIPALLFLAGVPIFRVVNIYILLVNLTTVLLCYYSFKGLFKDKYWGMFATTCYTLAGYRLTNIYVRSALGEYTAMAFLPLCIYGLYRIYANKTEKSIGFKKTIQLILPFVLGVTGLVESHILSTEMVALFVMLFILFNIKDIQFVLKPLIMSLVLILLINAFFIIPFLDSYISMDLVVNTSPVSPDLQGNGLYLNQLFGLITGGQGGNSLWSTENEGCFNVGLVIVCCEIATIAYMMMLLFNYFKKGVAIEQADKWVIQLTLLGILSMWMSTVYFPWHTISKVGFIGDLLGAVQYPWRYILIQNIIFVTTGTYSFGKILKREYLKFLLLIGCFGLAVLLTGVFDYQLSFSKNITAEQAAENWADKLYLLKGTDAEALKYTDVTFEDNKAILPVIAYKYVYVYDKDKNKLPIEVTEGNLIAVSKQLYNDEITIQFEEPWHWRLSEIISVISILGIVVITFRKN